ncbi:hypothetical protein [Conexibacter sp. DBS9H8]|uniref:hypothetical protein n=1 Tax=Conexibacter sp. DBS9H8 TaxID=2937801 RepID=UPI0020103C4B|nr:hypothetical protein [Conexibacter sp. DBS9H8]
MSITDALTRIADIQQQFAALNAGPAALAAGPGAVAVAAAGASAGAATAGNGAPTAMTPTPSTVTGMPQSAAAFAAALAAAQAAGAQPSGTPMSAGALASGLGTLIGAGAGTGTAGSLSGGVAPAAVALPPAATAQLTGAQQQFASTLVAQTGLNPAVVSAWLLAEESGSAAQARQAANNNDWLNVGYTDSGTVGAADAVWSNPVSAATATAQWLEGQASIPGYATASSGIQAILSTVGASPQAQISALQSSGWASSRYPDLPSLYAQVTGG